MIGASNEASRIPSKAKSRFKVSNGRELRALLWNVS
jgi:hypothetical protein